MDGNLDLVVGEDSTEMEGGAGNAEQGGGESPTGNVFKYETAIKMGVTS